MLRQSLSRCSQTSQLIIYIRFFRVFRCLNYTRFGSTAIFVLHRNTRKILIPNYSFGAYLFSVKVHKQTKFITCDSKVIDNLGCVNRQKFINSFQFYDYLVVNYKVSDVLLFKSFALIHNGEAFLTLERNTLKF